MTSYFSCICIIVAGFLAGDGFPSDASDFEMESEGYNDAFEPIALSLNEFPAVRKNEFSEARFSLNDDLIERTIGKVEKEIITPARSPIPVIHAAMPILAPNARGTYSIQYWKPLEGANYSLRITEVDVINPLNQNNNK